MGAGPETAVGNRKAARAKISDTEMHKRYTSPLALTKWLYNALKSARCPVP